MNRPVKQSVVSLTKATTIRLDPHVQSGLAIIQQATNRPVNKLVNEALVDFIQKGTVELEARLEDTLQRVRAYRRADPGLTRAIEAFVEDEAAFAADDPVDGKVIATTTGPALARVRDILRG